MIDDTFKRVAFFLFIFSVVICCVAWRAASGYQKPEDQLLTW